MTPRPKSTPLQRIDNKFHALVNEILNQYPDVKAAIAMLEVLTNRMKTATDHAKLHDEHDKEVNNE